MTELREIIALQFVEPLGFNPEADWQTIWVGNITDDAETGSLKYLCEALADAALAAIKEAGFVVVPKVPDEAKAEYHYIDVYRLLGEDGTRAEVAKRLAEYCASEVRAMIEAAGEPER